MSLEEKLLARMKERFEFWRHQWFMVYKSGVDEGALLRYFQSAYMDARNVLQAGLERARVEAEPLLVQRRRIGKFGR